MDDIEALWRSIDLTWIDGSIGRREQETLHLDFKTVPAGLDRKLLARTMSGFGNADGGVLVWGIDARRQPDGSDVASELRPIDAVAPFLSELTRYAAEAVNPAIEGVGHRVLQRSNCEPGFIATLIPRSDGGPFMAKFGEDRYFKRSGTQTLRMEHYEVADMFGRRRRPQLRLEAQLVRGSDTMARGERTVDVSADIGLWNYGRAIAVAPLVLLKPLPPAAVNPGSAVTNGFTRLELARPDGWHALGAHTGVVIHPATGLRVASVIRTLFSATVLSDLGPKTQ